MKPVLSVTVILLFGLLAACNLPGGATALPAASATGLPVEAETPAPTATPSLSPTPAPPNVQDLIDRCPTAAEIAAIDADVTLTFSGDPTAGTLVCRADQGSADLSLLQERAYQSLLVMRQLEFDQPLPWTSLSLFDWFTSVIHGVHFGSDLQYSSCCNPAGVMNLVTSLFALETDRWLQAEDADENVQSLMVLMIHEARHAEGYGHTCGTRDRTVSELGAFGVQYWTYVWLASHSDPAFMTPGGSQPDLYRQINRDKAVAYLVNSDEHGSPFCAMPSLTPGPTPTVP
jgi:hypothetical protein